MGAGNRPPASQTADTRGVTVGTVIHSDNSNSNYQLQGLLGWSDLSSVWQSRNDEGTPVAVKVSRRGRHDAFAAAQQELRALTALHSAHSTPSTGPSAETSLAASNSAPAGSEHSQRRRAWGWSWRHTAATDGRAAQAQIKPCAPAVQLAPEYPDVAAEGADRVTSKAAGSQSGEAQHNSYPCCRHTGQHHIARLLDHTLFYSTSGSQRHSGDPEPLQCLVLERLGNSLQEVLQYAAQSSRLSSGHNNGGSQHSAVLSSSHQQPKHTHQGPQGSAGAPQQEPCHHQKQQQRARLPVDCVKAMTRQVLHGLQHMHSCGWVHRDLKPANILTSTPVIPRKQRVPAGKPQHDWVKEPQLSHGTWKLIDFGNAVAVGSCSQHAATGKQQVSIQRPSAGASHRVTMPDGDWVLQTLSYAPPEDLLGASSHPKPDRAGQPLVGLRAQPESLHTPHNTTHGLAGQAATAQTWPPWAHPGNDMWSLGCVVYEAVTGCKLLDPHRCRHLLQASYPHEGVGRINRHSGLQQQCSMGPVPHAWLQAAGQQLLRHVTQFAGWSLWDSHHDNSTAGLLPVEMITDEELHLWQMTLLLGPVPPEMLQHASLDTAVEFLDPEGYARLEHHAAVRNFRVKLKSVTCTGAAAAAHEAGLLTTPGQADRQIGSWGLPSWSKGAKPQQQPRFPEQTGVLRAGQEAAAFAVGLTLCERLAVEADHLDPHQHVQLCNFLGQLLAYDPDERLDPKRALTHPWLARQCDVVAST